MQTRDKSTSVHEMYRQFSWQALQWATRDLPNLPNPRATWDRLHLNCDPSEAKRYRKWMDDWILPQCSSAASGGSLPTCSVAPTANSPLCLIEFGLLWSTFILFQSKPFRLPTSIFALYEVSLYGLAVSRHFYSQTRAVARC